MLSLSSPSEFNRALLVKCMIPGFDIDLLNKLGKFIGGLERFHLENAAPEEFDPADLLDRSRQAFFRIRGIANFWDQQSGVDFWQHIVDTVIGAHGQQKSDLVLVMLGTPEQLSVFLSIGDANTTRTILEGIFPGIVLDPMPTEDLLALLEPHFGIQGMITGIPSRKTFHQEGQGREEKYGQQGVKQPAGQQNTSQLERIVRGMYGATWAYVVQAHPRPRHKVVEERMKIIDLLTQVTSHSRTQWQSTKQDSLQMTTVESGSQTKTYSGDMINYRAQYLIRLLERELERLDQAGAVGQWTVRTYFGASSPDDARRLASLLLGTLAGSDSRPEPLRASLCQQAGQPLETFHTFLTSNEVATLVQFPREEVPGYAIHDYVSFDVDFQREDTLNLALGAIQQNGRDTRSAFTISLDALTKHAVVIGVTGSGKTTTVMNLLDRVVEAGKNFLVIEPAKTEYRTLRKALSGRADLRIYTLGNEMVAPFRLNPFEFETHDEPGNASVLTHIDFLKAVFNAAFPLYAPMPQVLEEALHEVYEDKGWDITSGINRRIPQWSDRHRYPIFPTLTDLYYKVEAVTNRLGYDDEIESNVKAGLKARIGSLRIGSKGLMLDTARSIPTSQLLATPTILELENIGNDDEKTFLMGLLLARLYEFRRMQAARGEQPSGLQHLIVFEEAHRLLQNTPTQVDTESSNMRAQAIEVFTNMLSEVRAYGQGVLVAEQIPSKLAPDVLKNTNLKIVHRLIAQDDRLSIGMTMNLREDQLKQLGILTPGMAAVYAEGIDHAYLVRMENYKRNLSPLMDAELKRISRSYASVKPFQAIIDIGDYAIPLAPTGGPDPATYQAVGKLLDTAKSKWFWATLLLRMVSYPGGVVETLVRISELIEAEMPYLPANQQNDLIRMLIVRGSAEILHERGARFGWNYAQVESLRTYLTRGLLGLIEANFLATGEYKLELEELQQRIEEQMDRASECLDRFLESYTTLMRRKQGPFIGCIHCQARCFYRADVNTLLSAKDQQWIIDELSSDTHETMEERYEALAEAASNIAQSWLGDEQKAAGIGYCAVLHTTASDDFSEYEQQQVGGQLNAALFG